jgi:hypothetical protein
VVDLNVLVGSFDCVSFVLVILRWIMILQPTTDDDDDDDY